MDCKNILRKEVKLAKEKIMKRLGILVLAVFFVSAGLVFANGVPDSESSSGGAYRDTSIGSAPKIIKSKIAYVPKRDSKLNDAGMWEESVVINVELREETGGDNAGQKYTFLTVKGIMYAGGQIETLSGSQLQWYQSNYGGRRNEYEYDDIR
jgi:hypothetical protein